MQSLSVFLYDVLTNFLPAKSWWCLEKVYHLIFFHHLSFSVKLQPIHNWFPSATRLSAFLHQLDEKYFQHEWKRMKLRKGSTCTLYIEPFCLKIKMKTEEFTIFVLCTQKENFNNNKTAKKGKFSRKQMKTI